MVGNDAQEAAQQNDDIPGQDWVAMDDLVAWPKGQYDDACKGGKCHKQFKKVAIGFGVAPGNGWKDCIHNLREFGRDAQVRQVLGDKDGDQYLPPHVVSPAHFETLREEHHVDASRKSRLEAVRLITRAQKTVLRKHAGEEESGPKKRGNRE